MDASSLYDCLKPTQLCDFSKAPEIRQKAISLTKNLSTQQSKAENLYLFVKELPFKYDDWNIKASDTLKRGWGMCSGKTNLLVAMLRAIEIPSRYAVVLCRAEIELYEWLANRNTELAKFCQTLPDIGHHIYTEVYLGDWKTYDAARDPTLERGFTKLGIPYEIKPVKDGVNETISVLSSLDEWASKRQEATHIKENRQELLLNMNKELDTIRNFPASP